MNIIEPTQSKLQSDRISSPGFTQQRGQAFQRHVVLIVLRLHGCAEIQRQGVDATIRPGQAPEVLQGGAVEVTEMERSPNYNGDDCKHERG